MPKAPESRSRYSVSLDGSRALSCVLRRPRPTDPDQSTPSAAGATDARTRSCVASSAVSLDFMSASSQEELAAHGRRVAAVEIVVAIHAAARDEPRAGDGRGGREVEALLRAIDRSRVLGGVVAVLAHVGGALGEQAIVVGAVGVVAREAVLLHRRMPPDERPALFRVAGGAELVHRL